MSNYIRRTFSATPEIMAKGMLNARRRGFGSSFSAYVAWLIERDDSGKVEREEVFNSTAFPPVVPTRGRKSKKEKL